MPSKILILDRFSLQAEGLLKTSLPDATVERMDPKAEHAQLAEATAVIIRTKFKITPYVLDHMKNLKLVITVTSGFDHIDVEECHKRNIQVVFTPEGNQISAAEMTMGLALAAARQIPSGDRMVRKTQANQNWDREPLKGFELSEKSWGIIGLGRIGRLVATRARAFGMRVSAFDPYASDEAFDETGVERVSLIELQRASDIVSLHVPLTRETHHMINLKSLENFQEDAWLINTSRGSVVHEKDLAEALDRSWLAGAALDVFEHEPLSNLSPLLKHPKVVVSPHCGANTVEAFERGCAIAAQRVIEFFSKKQVTGGDPLQEKWFLAHRTSPFGSKGD